MSEIFIDGILDEEEWSSAKLIDDLVVVQPNTLEKSKYKTEVLYFANEKGIFVQASLERMMKFGVGICGSCCVSQDLVCRDGTVFDGQYLAKNSEFGHLQRTKSGILEEI